MNPQRGDVPIEIGGRVYPLCLTLGALAEIEHVLGCRSLGELDVRLKAVSASEVSRLLAILLVGGDNGIVDADAISKKASPHAAAKALAACFASALA